MIEVNGIQVAGLSISGGTAGVTTFNGRDGAVVPQAGDYTAAMVGALPDTTVVPTKTSELTNDSGFLTSVSVPSTTSQLTNDSGYVTQTDVDSAIQAAITAAWGGSY